jgi:phosphoribosylformimino-5-aminoimidazole carboxamide ribotide isomerase
MTNMFEMRRSRLLGGAALFAVALSAGLPSAAHAQATSDQDDAAQTQPETEEAQADAAAQEIVVTGFRRSLESSLAVKRNTEFIVDVVTADDIAGLPDVSIAESLARLPGVTSQRTGGQASAINIRGLSQDLVSATLNGREQVATSGNRVIEFDQYPSELLSQAAVYKTPIARLIEGGVAGKVELQTARPLSNRDDFSVTLNLRGSYNDRADESPDVSSYGYRASASVQAKLLDDTLGLALGYARLYQPNVATRFVQFDFTPAGQNGAPTLDLDGNGVPERRGFGFEGVQFGGRETRDAVIGVVQYEPVSSLRILIDGYYSRFKSDVARRGLRVFNPQSGDTIITNPVIVDDAIVGGTFTNRFGVNGFNFALGTELINQDEGRRDELYTFGGNIAYDFSETFTAALDVSYSRGESFFNNSGVNLVPFTQTAAGLRRTDQIPGAISVDYQLNGLNLPTIRNISTDFTDRNAFRFSGLFIVPQRDIDELFAVAADFTVDVDGPFVKSFQFGGRYAQRDGERIITSFRTFGPDAGPLAIPAELFRVAGFSGAYGRAGLPNFGVADIDGLLDLGVGEDRVADQEFGFTRDQSFTMQEDTYAGYAQLNFDTLAGGLPLRGNLGLRVVRTEQGSTPQGTSAAGLFIGDEYTDFLPSANFILELSPQDLLRLSATRQISRPRFFELRGAIDVNVSANGGPPSGSGGNPLLRPFRANQFDIAYEHYFGSTGVFAVAAFYKDLESYIVGGRIDQFDFSDFQFAPPPANQPGTLTGQLSGPVNGSGGYVYGVEFNFTKTFTELPEPFDGIGVVLNYSYADSDLNFPSSRSGRPLDLPLPGLSKHVANPTIFYEKSGFGARLGARYRSSFVAPQIGLDEQIVTNASETVFDAQISYEFPETSALARLKLLAQANNFTDEPTRSFFGVSSQTGTIQRFGRTFFLGATYKF